MRHNGVHGVGGNRSRRAHIIELGSSVGVGHNRDRLPPVRRFGFTQHTNAVLFACGSKEKTILFVYDFSALRAEKSYTKKKSSTALPKAQEAHRVSTQFFVATKSLQTLPQGKIADCVNTR
jgi:hypothetical protein